MNSFFLKLSFGWLVLRDWKMLPSLFLFSHPTTLFDHLRNAKRSYFHWSNMILFDFWYIEVIVVICFFENLYHDANTFSCCKTNVIILLDRWISLGIMFIWILRSLFHDFSNSSYFSLFTIYGAIRCRHFSVRRVKCKSCNVLSEHCLLSAYVVNAWSASYVTCNKVCSYVCRLIIAYDSMDDPLHILK